MKQTPQYPAFNDHPYSQRPILSVYGKSILGELIWLVIPLAIVVLALLLR